MIALISLAPYLILQSSGKLHLPLHLNPIIPVSNDKDQAYFIYASFGTPPQELKLYLTAWPTVILTQTTVIPNIGGKCKASDYFDPSNSTTFKSYNKQDSVIFEEGDTLSGTFVSDTVNIDDLEVSVADFNFLLAQSCSGSKKLSGGVLGLGFTESKMKNSTLVRFLKIMGLINQAVFSLYFSNVGFNNNFAPKKESALIIGGFDTKYALHPGKSFDFHSVVLNSEHWYLNLYEVRFGPMRLVNDYNVIIDPGSKYLYGPYTDVSRIHLLIKSSHLCFTNGGVFKCFCQRDQHFRTFTFVIDGNDYQLESTWFIENDAGVCTVHLYGIDEKRWILGQIFLRKYYSFWDYDNKRIGFMRSINTFGAAENTAESWSNISTVVMSIVIAIVCVGVLVVVYLKNKAYKELKNEQFVETLGIN